MKLKSLLKLITDLCSRKFHGHLYISFDHGNITLVRPDQSLRDGSEYLFVKQENL